MAKRAPKTLVKALGVSRDVVWIEFIDMSRTHFAAAGKPRGNR